jgi:DNA processing protein
VRGGTGPADGHEEAYAAALAGLPGMWPPRLVTLLGRQSPIDAWADIRSGRIERPPPRASARAAEADGGDDQIALFPSAPDGRPGPRNQPTWAELAARTDPVARWAPAAAAGIGVTWPGRPDYPAALEHDPNPPGVLFWKGRLDSLDLPCVALVGTRNASPDGRSVAFEMGRDLAAAGVCVVSGLALGIDGAAHAGALAAISDGAPGRTVGVAASGVDVPYPRRHAVLWREVTATGAILSESLPGRAADSWRFPTRNRIIAGLAQMVVVVESHERGGSLITAEAAMERGVEVRVVPGPVHNPACAGSNQLLYDGPGPVRNARDVLDAIGLLRADGPPRGAAGAAAVTDGSPAGARRRAGPGAGVLRPPADPKSGRVLQALGWRPVSMGQLMTRTGLDAASVMLALDDLVTCGFAGSENGWWVRRR